MCPPDPLSTWEHSGGTKILPSAFRLVPCALQTLWAHECTLKALSFSLQPSNLHHAPSYASLAHECTPKSLSLPLGVCPAPSISPLSTLHTREAFILSLHPSDLCHAPYLDYLPLLSTWEHSEAPKPSIFTPLAFQSALMHLKAPFTPSECTEKSQT